MSYFRKTLNFVLILKVCFLGASYVTAAPSFVAHVDKTNIATGETITLTLEFSGRSGGEPDFSDLAKDFSIVSRQTSNETTLINGDLHAKTSWILELLPKKSSKTLTIPSIHFGSQASSPIAVNQSESKHKNGQDVVSLSVSTDRDSVYLNAQLILNIEIKTHLVLRHGTLTKLEIPDAIVEPLNEDAINDVIENGIKYRVIKKGYAIFPSKAGTLMIPSIGFTGVAADDRARGRMWPGFFSGGSKVSSARSSEVKVKVKDVPKEFPGDRPFLPVKQLVVIESFDEANPKFELNKATIRRFEIKAQGTLATFLPNIAVPRIQGLNIYSESGEKTTSGTENGMEAKSKMAHVYMPAQTGKVEIPVETIYWWDTETDKLRTTEIRALDIDVVGTKAPIPEPPPNAPNEPKTTNEEVVTPTKDQKALLKSLIGLLMLILLASGIIFWLYKKKQFVRLPITREPRDQFKEMIKSIVADCDVSDGKRVYLQMQDLRKWAEKNSHGEILTDALLNTMRKLENALFDQRKSSDIASTLAEIKEEVLRLKLHYPAKKELAPLYPN